MTKSDTEILMKSLIDAAESDDKEAGLKAIVAIAVTFLDNQDRQTKAMERLAAAMEAQVALVEKQVNPLIEVKT